MKIGLCTKRTNVEHAMWRALDPNQKLLAVALGLYRIDDAGLPMLEPEMLCKRLKEIEAAAGATP